MGKRGRPRRKIETVAVESIPLVEQSVSPIAYPKHPRRVVVRCETKGCVRHGYNHTVMGNHVVAVPNICLYCLRAPKVEFV